MQCPVHPDAEMAVHIRDGIEVRRCPVCRGLWLDHDEVERLLDLVEAWSPGSHVAARAHQRPSFGRVDRPDADPLAARRGDAARLLEEVFDVFD